MNKKRQGNILVATGLLLITAAFCLAGYNIMENNAAGRNVQQVMEQLQQTVPQKTEDSTEFISNTDRELPVQEIDGLAYVGTVSMPSVGLELPVLSQWSESGRKMAPCRYTGTPYAANMVIAAHNYKVHFQPIRDLEAGDTVVFTDVEGNSFTYTVALTEILERTDVQAMTDSSWALTLFTCTFDAQQHVTVRCEQQI